MKARKLVLMLQLGWMIASLSSAFCQTYLFNRADYLTGLGPNGVTLADFNHDGKLDLATANSGNDNISVLLGTKDGRFGAKTDYPAKPDTFAITSGDFNNDGKLDLATANRSGAGTISVFYGNGDGSFQAQVVFNAADSAQGIIAADFNRDGKVDLATADSGNPGNLSVLLNDGNGGFPTHTEFTAGNASGIAAGDVNGDGKLDLVAANKSSPGTISVFLGDGTGSFGNRTDYTADTNTSGVAIGDLNGDGHPDIVTANTSLSVSVFLNDGFGGFPTRGTDYEILLGDSVLLADLNADGKLDVAVGSWNNSIGVLLGSGDGTLQSRKDYGAGLRVEWLAAGDINGDAREDLVTVNHGGTGEGKTVSVLINDGDGGFVPRRDFPLADGPQRLVSADFNNDTHADVAVTSTGPKVVSVLLGNGDGSFQPRNDFAVGNSPNGVTAADFGNDLKLDLVVANLSSDNISYLSGKGDGTFNPKADFPAGDGSRSVVAADFNRDGNMDAATVNQFAATVSVLLGNGAGGFPTKIDTALGTGSNPLFMSGGDFNKDGKPDLVVANRASNTGVLSVLMGDGSGQFAKTDYVLPVGAFPLSVQVADINGDSQLDLITANGNKNSISVLLGTGGGTFGPAAHYFAGSPQDLAIVDLDHDGRPDVAASSGVMQAGIGIMAILLQQPDGSFSAPIAYFTYDNALSIVAADFNQDGDPDLAIANNKSNDVNEFLTVLISTPVAAAFPLSVTFPTQVIQTTSAAKSVTVTNSGGGPLTVSGVSASGDFAVKSNGCGTLANGESCVVKVTFTPSDKGQRTGTLSIHHNAGVGEHVIALRGTGTVVQLLPNPRRFGQVVVGQNLTKAVTMTNLGTTFLNISQIKIGGLNALDFTQTNNCGSGLAAGQSCKIKVTFTPSDLGKRRANLNVFDDGGGSPQQVKLKGTGI